MSETLRNPGRNRSGSALSSLVYEPVAASYRLAPGSGGISGAFAPGGG